MARGAVAVHDVATMQEVDHAVRYSVGLHWALPVPSLPHPLRARPALKWPWTKLTDVPELIDNFLDTLAEQSATQAENLTIPELEQKHEDCLVAMLQGLRSQSYGAGKTARALGTGAARPRCAVY
ncbi:hypothetical protein ACVIM8_001816 [Bradyrhizobium sp. USDA 4529]